jgi:hypothetical protein
VENEEQDKSTYNKTISLTASVDDFESFIAWFNALSDGSEPSCGLNTDASYI